MAFVPLIIKHSPHPSGLSFFKLVPPPLVCVWVLLYVSGRPQSHDLPVTLGLQVCETTSSMTVVREEKEG